MSKVLVFSDNLDLAKAVDLYRHFNPSEPELRDWYPFDLRHSSGKTSEYRDKAGGM
jgi:hypothetical protein